MHLKGRDHGAHDNPSGRQPLFLLGVSSPKYRSRSYMNILPFY